MPAWLVTGATGFLGRHLLAALLGPDSPGVDVLTMGRRRPPGWPSGRFLEADILDPRAVGEALREADPAVVVHVAGRTPPAASDELYRANTVATAFLLDALRERRRPVRVVLAGSAAELGPVDEADLPVGEGHPCRPVDAYGLSKLLATTAGLAARPPLEVMVARIFNPIGPGTPEGQAFGRFAARLADPRLEHLTVGGLDGRRDFVDVRDVARALIAVARRGRAGLVYHVGSGRSWRVGDGLERLRQLSGSRAEVTVDPGLAAQAGPRDSRADIRRIVEHTGWRPRIAWEQSLDDLWAEVQGRPRLTLTA